MVFWRLSTTQKSMQRSRGVKIENMKGLYQPSVRSGTSGSQDLDTSPQPPIGGLQGSRLQNGDPCFDCPVLDRLDKAHDPKCMSFDVTKSSEISQVNDQIVCFYTNFLSWSSSSTSQNAGWGDPARGSRVLWGWWEPLARRLGADPHHHRRAAT